MSMSKKYEKREIKKDQLLPERGFIRFCNEDQANTYVGGRMEINEQFLRAAERDNFIKPLLQVGGKMRQNDGTEKDGLVNHYSPHQIYLLAELRHNIIDEDRNLRAPDTVDWYKERPKEQRPRYIEWGRGHSFWANNPKRRDEDEDNLWVGAHLLSEYLHSFLELLHSFEQPKERYYLPVEKRRYWSNAPITEYNFKPLKSGGKKLLAVYGLDERKLNILRRSIGQFAEVIDPLAHWHYYIEQHPEWKKDLLKGDASLAQELYRLYGLLTEVWEVIAKKKSEPIFEFIHQDFPHHPFWRPKIEYVGGEDIKALQYAIQQFKKWRQKKTNKPFATDEVTKKIDEAGKKFADYEKRYGDRSYAGSYREIVPEENLKIDDLDEGIERYVISILKQIKEQDTRIKDEEDEEKETWEEKVKNEISMAIMHRLSDLQRELRELFWDVSKQFSDKRSAAWQRERDFGNRWWMENREKIKDLSHDERLKLANAERKKIIKEAKDWEGREKKFHQSVSWYADIVFCKSCREKPVRQHSENPSNMWERNRSLICDDCLKNASEQTGVKGGEWHCNYCGKLLYKFVAHNLISDVLINTANAKIRLEYGKMSIAARCPNRSCKRENEITVSWGWMP